MDTGAKPIPRRWFWRKYFLIPLAGFCLLTGIARLGWGWYADRQLQKAIDAIHARGETLDWRDLMPPPVPDDQNAAPLYESAGGLHFTVSVDEGTKELADKFSDLLANRVYRQQHPEELKATLHLSSQLLTTCRQIRLQRMTASWNFDVASTAYGIKFPKLGSYRTAVKVLCLAAIDAHAEGNDAEGVEYVFDALWAGRQSRRFSSVIGDLVGTACDAHVSSCLEEIAATLQIGDGPSCKPEQIPKLVAELLDEQPAAESLYKGFIFERAGNLEVFQRLANGESDESEILGHGDEWVSIPVVRQLGSPLIKMDAIAMLNGFMPQIAAAGQSRYCGPLPTMSFSGSIKDQIAHRYSVRLTPTLGRAFLLHWQALAMRRMAALALLMRMYELENGSKPAKLELLVPKYLPALPEDPFDPSGGTFGYLPDAPQPILYSRHQNQIDDGGMVSRRSDGSIDMEGPDLPFFLDGLRPQAPVKTPATGPVPTLGPPAGPGGPFSGPGGPRFTSTMPTSQAAPLLPGALRQSTPERPPKEGEPSRP